jgi:hypothetical protein
MALEAVEMGAMNGDVYEVEHELPAREVNRNGNGFERELPLARKVNGKANGIERQLPSDGAARDALAVPLAPATRKVKVVEVGTGIEHELPGDTATRDARTLAYFSYPSGAVLPVVIRPPDVAFYVCSDPWPELLGKLVRRCG